MYPPQKSFKKSIPSVQKFPEDRLLRILMLICSKFTKVHPEFQFSLIPPHFGLLIN